MLQYFPHMQSLKTKILYIEKHAIFRRVRTICRVQKARSLRFSGHLFLYPFSVRSSFGVFISFRGFCDAQLKYERFPFYE